MPNDKVFLDIEPGFEQYGDKFQFVLGKATSWDTEERVVSVQRSVGEEVALHYHALILATGSKTVSPTQSSWANSFKETSEALSAMHGKLATAKSIVIAGGGPAGVETAAEPVEKSNGVAGWFQARPSRINVDITFSLAPSSFCPACSNPSESKRRPI
jgi:NADH dehydrogenase FAD-containing subunit